MFKFHLLFPSSTSYILQVMAIGNKSQKSLLGILIYKPHYFLYTHEYILDFDLKCPLGSNFFKVCACGSGCLCPANFQHGVRRRNCILFMSKTLRWKRVYDRMWHMQGLVSRKVMLFHICVLKLKREPFSLAWNLDYIVWQVQCWHLL